MNGYLVTGCVALPHGETNLINFMLNDENISVEAEDGTTLLSLLSETLQLSGVKYGCGKSQCGACAVLVDGAKVISCSTAAISVAGRSVTTLAGLMENGEPNALQKAFITEQAAQCGYCTSGMIISAQEILDNNPNPSDAEIRAGLNGNLCRCGTHNRVVKAVLRAAEEV
jgi:nicotinate dehydrogenase subunit A